MMLVGLRRYDMGLVMRPAFWCGPLLLGLVLASVACSSVNTISVNPAECSFSKVGASLQLDVEPRDRRGAKMSGVMLTYQSRDASVANVSSAGLVTATGHGSATLVVQAEGTDVMEFVRVVVRLPKRVEVRPANTSVFIGGVEKLTAKVLDYDDKVLQNVPIEWSTSNEKIATVLKGDVTGLDEGDVVITAKGLDLEGQSNIRVAWEPRLKAVLEQEKRFFKGRGGGRRNSGSDEPSVGQDPRLGIFQD